MTGMLVVPPRSDLRHRPIETERLLLAPVDPADSHEVWLAVSGSRAVLSRWLPWVQF
jgi:ribosomal-protein-serine acetyltransferase